MPSESDLLADFDGTARLFPLPRLVFFPHVVQGLHIFEQRYRELMADALADNMLMAIVMLREGWDKDYDGEPPIERVGCLGRIGVHEKLPDGRYNLRLHGLRRIKIIGELPTTKPYRLAHAEILTDIVPEELSDLKALRTLVADAVLPRFDADPSASRQLDELFRGETPLGTLTDMLAYALPLPLDLKQQLLCEVDVRVRAEVLADAMMVKTASRDRKFPPDFSIN